MGLSPPQSAPPTTISTPAGRADRADGRDLDIEDLLRRLLDARDIFDIVEPIAARQVSRVGRLVLPDGRRVVVKRYEYSWAHGACWIGRTCKTRREHEVLDALLRSGNPVRSLAWGERRRGGVLRRAVIIMDELTGATDHRSFRWKHGPDLDDDAKRRLGASLVPSARTLAGLHADGWYLRDASDKNLLVRPEGGAFDVVAFADLPRARRSARGPTGVAERADDVASIDKGFLHVYGRTTRLRLVLAYLGKERLDAEARAFIAAVERARAKREHRTPLAALKHWFTVFGRRLPGYRWALGRKSWSAASSFAGTTTALIANG